MECIYNLLLIIINKQITYVYNKISLMKLVEKRRFQTENLEMFFL